MDPKTDNGEDHDIFSKLSNDLMPDIINEVMKLNDQGTTIKFGDNALLLVKDITKAMIIEAVVRAAKLASTQNKTVISCEHVTSILFQLMLDFP